MAFLIYLVRHKCSAEVGDLVVIYLQAVEGAHVFAVKMEDGTLIFSHGDRSSLPGNEEIIGVIRAAGAGEQTI